MKMGNPSLGQGDNNTIETVDFAGSTTESNQDTRASSGGSALAGFFVSGFLLALLRAILPAWVYLPSPSAITSSLSPSEL